MDGAINMNPSNAPRALTPYEAKKVEKSIAKDAAAAEKHVARVGKTLKSAEKEEGKAEKAAKKVQQAREKAVKQEYKTDQSLSNAQHKHDRAVADKNKAENDLTVYQKHLQEVHRTVESRRTEFERAQREKDAGDVTRKERLQQARQGTGSGAAGPSSV
ncbi:hypothetical protein BC827DRAFT_220888 [Russula dissimulans]|nr:hypothetical protein BC827DRAFT_220888 [Russula dissimulans]